MWRNVLEIFAAAILAKKNGKAFEGYSVEQLERELVWLEQMAKDSGHIADETGLRGQYGGHRE